MQFEEESSKENKYKYGPSNGTGESHYQKFTEQRGIQPPKQIEQKVNTRGHLKGFSNDHFSDLINNGPQGPLDFARNDGARDVNVHNMNKISNRINDYQH